MDTSERKEETEEAPAKKIVVWDAQFIHQLRDYLGEAGKEFFQELYEKHGHFNVVLSCDVKRNFGNAGPLLPHPVHMREGMDVRNAMRDIHTAIGHPHESAHWYDNSWQSAVKACLGIPTTCMDCDDSGDSFVLRGGRYDKIPCPKCKG